MAGLAVTLGIAILGGLFTGFVTSRQWFQPPKPEQLFDDRFSWFNCTIEHEELHQLKQAMTMSKMNNSGVNKQNSREERPHSILVDQDDN